MLQSRFFDRNGHCHETMPRFCELVDNAESALHCVTESVRITNQALTDISFQLSGADLKIGGASTFRELSQWLAATGGTRSEKVSGERKKPAPFEKESFVWSEGVASTMDELERMASDVRRFATEVRRLGYSSAAGSENEFLDLSDRMTRLADTANKRSYGDRPGR